MPFLKITLIKDGLPEEKESLLNLRFVELIRETSWGGTDFIMQDGGVYHSTLNFDTGTKAIIKEVQNGNTGLE